MASELAGLAVQYAHTLFGLVSSLQQLFLFFKVGQVAILTTACGPHVVVEERMHIKVATAPT